MNTKRSKRWNGDVKNLTADYLKNVIEKMQAYGASAQFSKNGTVGSTSTPRGGSALAKAKEAIAIQKYEYYKTHRATLPSDIREHSEEITRMMEKGMSAEDAFAEAIKLCFDH